MTPDDKPDSDNFMSAARKLGANFLRGRFGAAGSGEPSADPASGLPIVQGREIRTEIRNDDISRTDGGGYVGLSRRDVANLTGRALDGDEGAIALLAGRLPGGAVVQTEQEKKKKREYDERLREATRLMLEDIERQMDALRQRMEELEIEIARKKKYLKDLSELEEQIKLAFQHYYKNGDFELDENGRLQNKKWEEILRAHEQRTGQSVDRNDPRSVFFALRQEKEWMTQEQERTSTGLRQDEEEKILTKKKYEDLEDESTRIAQIKDPQKKLEAIQNSSMRAVILSETGGLDDAVNNREVKIDADKVNASDDAFDSFSGSSSPRPSFAKAASGAEQATSKVEPDAQLAPALNEFKKGM